MPGERTVIATFEVALTRCLDRDGTPIGELPDFAASDVELSSMYRAMVRARTFDAKAVALQRTGRLGTYASPLGQEAIGVGTAAAMRDDDVLVPSFREHGAQLWRGVTPVELFLYWGGDERGMDFGGPREDFPICIPVGSHPPHAAGAALGFKLRGEPRVAVCMLGDGATSKGDFYEGLNFAGVEQLPLVTVVANNAWAISTPRERQTHAGTLAQKAIAVGIEGVQVDGNDIVAMRAVAAEAIERARAGGGPTLIEALTYRLGDHTTADDARRYRPDEEVSDHWRDDPVVRLRALLEQHGWTRDDEQALVEQTRDEIEAAADEYLALPALPPEAMFDHLFETLPVALAPQRDLALARAAATERASEERSS